MLCSQSGAYSASVVIDEFWAGFCSPITSVFYNDELSTFEKIFMWPTGFVFAPIGIPAMVSNAGDEAGYHGKRGIAILGGLLLDGFYWSVVSSNPPPEVQLIATLYLVNVVGSVIGYHASDVVADAFSKDNHYTSFPESTQT